MRSRLARGALVFAVVAPLVYLAQRLFERWQGGPGDPLGVVRELHTAFYWRSATAVWLGLAMAALVSRPLPEGREGRPWLPHVAAAAWAGLVLTLAALYP